MLGRLLGSTAATAVAAMLVVGACSGGDNTSSGSSTSVAPTGPTAATVASGGVGPTVATTAIPGAPGAPTTAPAPGGTLPPQPTTTIPVQPGSPPPPAPTGAPSGGDTAAPSPPGPTSPPVTDIVDGDPTTFCPSVERAVPLYYVVSIGGLVGGPGTPPPTRWPWLRRSPARSPTPPPARRRWWLPRSSGGLTARPWRWRRSSPPAPPTRRSPRSARDYAAQIETLTDEGGSQNPPDPIDAAVAAGIDRGRLMSAAAAFQAANGSFDSFSATLGQDVTLTPAAQQKLEQLFPCAADLTNFTG